ncbi:MAG: CoA transferase [Anaerolineaceae bacterium]
MKRLPLEGVRVLDLTMMWAGPYATRLLAEMGAEILKIESPSAWDNIRTVIPLDGITEPWNASWYFNDYNRDKKSVTLDLAQARGRELFLGLVAQSDVVIENYRSAVMDNLGIGYETLRAAREDIIMVSMAGFGKFGAERDHVGFGPIIEQMSGLASLTGYGDDGVPYKTGVSYGDPVAGKAAAAAVAMGLIKRQKTGRGVHVDLGQRETMSTLIGEAFVAASLRGEQVAQHGNRDSRFAPQGVYRCIGIEQWLAISVRTDDEWRALASVIDADSIARLSLHERLERHDELDALVAAWAAGQDPQDAMETLQWAGVAAGRVLDSESIHDDPHLAARGYWVELPHPRMHAWKQPTTTWRFFEANPQLSRHAPLFGEHTREVLSSLLGVSASELDALQAQAVIGDAPLNPGIG